jgi:hypothetical protein
MLLSLSRCHETPVAGVAPTIAPLNRAASSSVSSSVVLPQIKLLQNSEVPVLDSCVMPVRSLAEYLWFTQPSTSASPKVCVD